MVASTAATPVPGTQPWMLQSLLPWCSAMAATLRTWLMPQQRVMFGM